VGATARVGARCKCKVKNVQHANVCFVNFSLRTVEILSRPDGLWDLSRHARKTRSRSLALAGKAGGLLLILNSVIIVLHTHLCSHTNTVVSLWYSVTRR
jgi:hypothetical protein